MDSDHAIRVSRSDCPSTHSTANKIGRVLWGVVWCLLFRPSPKIMLGWRRLLLRVFGARVGKGAKIMPSTRIWAPWHLVLGEEACLSHDVDCYSVAQVNVGAHATVSQRAFLCTATHDIQDPHMKLITAPVTIGDGAWICAGAYIAPGLTVGEGAVAGARAVVTRSVDAWTIVAGNPARPIGKRGPRQENQSTGHTSP